MRLRRSSSSRITRRNFVRSCIQGSVVLASKPLWGVAQREHQSSFHSGPSQLEYSMDQDWLFGGRVGELSGNGAASDASFEKITLPHCVAKLSWQDWDPALWEDVWVYRRHFTLPPEFAHRRVFVNFDAAMVTAEVTINGISLPEHKGGYLPFTYEITQALEDGENVLELRVDSRFLNVPPEGSPRGPKAVDYFLPGGIIRGARIFAVPQAYISDVFAKPVDVLKRGRRVEIKCSVNSAADVSQVAHLEARIIDGSKTVGKVTTEFAVAAGNVDVVMAMKELEEVQLWDVDGPKLYDVVVTLKLAGHPIHEYRTRIGFREAKFTVDGFFLNGRRLRLFGLDRHELYPYVGYAMSARTMRLDAEIIKNEFHCNVVRCSHYPQSPAFLDACDELGLMVWEETPGWQYIGDAAFQEQVVQNVEDMILRDRNRPSVVIWGVRVNESRNDPALYSRTTALAKSLDNSRPDSGSMTGFGSWKTDWQEDVYSMDDYHALPDGSLGIYPPLPGIPYMLSETVGQRTYTAKGFGNIYRRGADPEVQYKQALYHAQAHDKALGYPRFCGVIAWCAYEYGSPMNSYKGVKYPGVADIFRVPKLGASFYQAQVSPDVRPVITPNFYWDFGKATPHGPGKHVAIFSNCEHLELSIDGKPYTTAMPDRKNFPNIRFAPSFVDLELDGQSHPELRIDGFVAGRKVLSRSFSSNPNEDRFVVEEDSRFVDGDGIDSVRVVLQVTDRFGAPRLFAEGDVSFNLDGPGILVGDNPFSLTESGGVGAVWVRGKPGSRGRLTLTATHERFGSRTITLDIRPDTKRRLI